MCSRQELYMILQLRDVEASIHVGITTTRNSWYEKIVPVWVQNAIEKDGAKNRMLENRIFKGYEEEEMTEKE